MMRISHMMQSNTQLTKLKLLSFQYGNQTEQGKKLHIRFLVQVRSVSGAASASDLAGRQHQH